MSSVTVSHVSPAVTVAALQEFFSFCGSIDSINQVESNDAKFLTYQVNFASEKALETALLLNDAELENVAVKVEEIKLPPYSSSMAKEFGDHKVQSNTSSNVNSNNLKFGDTKSAEFGNAKLTGDSQYDDISQEEKPKSAILAQLLASGYKVSDDLINKAISIDRQKGYSNKFVSFLSNLDSKYVHSQDPQSATARNISKAQTSWSQLANQVQRSAYSQRLQNYFDRSMNTQYGMRVHQFYKSVSKEVVDVHNEAKRLMELKRMEGARGQSRGEEVNGGAS